MPTDERRGKPCQKCGGEVHTTAKACPTCGQSVEAESDSTGCDGSMKPKLPARGS
jgi:endogenous inhibitor of DNA gyrase (YacG/DUF329 family)